MNDPRILSKILRAIASGTQAQESRQDIIFNAAALELDRLVAVVDELANASQSEATSRLRQLAKSARIP